MRVARVAPFQGKPRAAGAIGACRAKPLKTEGDARAMCEGRGEADGALEKMTPSVAAGSGFM